MPPYSQDNFVAIYHGDSKVILPELPDNSVDLLATDPPYGIGMMGKDWDKALPDKAIWAECLRVLKPGAFAFVMSIPRMDCLSRMGVSLEEVGFNVSFSPIYHCFASGFPKAMSISKAVDKGRVFDRVFDRALDIEEIRSFLRGELRAVDKKMIASVCHVTVRQVDHWIKVDETQPQVPTLEKWRILQEHFNLSSKCGNWDDLTRIIEEIDQPISWYSGDRFRRVGTTPQAKALDGSYGGFQPKPAVEVIIVAMKPLSEKTFVDQALKNGKGITWLDDCRVPYESEDKPKGGFGGMDTGIGKPLEHQEYRGSLEANPQGRFPANLLVSDDVLNDGEDKKTHGGGKGSFGGIFGNGSELIDKGALKRFQGDSGSFSRYFDLDAWWEERVKQLPQSVQRTFPFLIVPKASKSEKNKGLDGLERKSKHTDSGDDHVINEICPYHHITLCECGWRSKPVANYHPTVKPLKLMSYLITLGSREGDIVLDPFLGSGTTALACKMLGRKCLGIELEERYREIATNRCRQMVLL